MARPGEGKSGGYRTLIATNKSIRWISVFGSPKNERGNIDQGEEEALRKVAVNLLSPTPKEIDTAVHAGGLKEVDCDAQDKVIDS